MMADELSESEIVKQFAKYGETVRIPRNKSKLMILRKKLNHLQAKQRRGSPSARQKLPVRDELDRFSSDETDSEAMESAASPTRAGGRVCASRTNSMHRRESPPRNLSDSAYHPSWPSPGGPRHSSSSRDIYGRKGPSRAAESPGEFTVSFDSSDSDLDGGGSSSMYEVEDRGAANMSRTLSGAVSPQLSALRTSTPRFVDERRQRTNRRYSNQPLNSNKTNSYSDEQLPPRHRIPGKGESLKDGYSPSSRVSVVLQAIVVVFFICLAVLYLRNVSSENLAGPDNNEVATNEVMKMCNDSWNCDLLVAKNPLKVLNDLFINLSVRVGNAECGYYVKGENRYMTVKDIEMFITNQKIPDSMVKDMTVLMLQLIIEKKEWGISPLTSTGEVAANETEVAFVESKIPYMGLRCRLMRAINLVLSRIAMVILCLVAICVGVCWMWQRHKAKEEQQHQVFEMVEQIIDLLKCHCETASHKSEDPFLAVQHVRDQLLIPSKRKQLRPVWDKAVKFIEDNESRIRLETKTIEGEAFTVWRWLPNFNNGGKVWQGQAFGECDEISCNSPPYSPTPCLKVRNMFDADMEVGHNWHVSIEDAILEKCKNIDGILHIYVDQNSKEGCVYMKCDSCETTGQVYKAVHGWWFDRRLVTMKYLRLEYYHERFPESRSAVSSLRPSTGRMQSLSQPFHRSMLEMT